MRTSHKNRSVSNWFISPSGFTLIEVLVVIAIIGILASIVLASLDTSRKKGRDARRLSDIKQIQLALEVYYDQNNSFPPNIASAANSCGAGITCASLLTTPGYISVVPQDPSNQHDYDYVPYASTAAPSTCISYHLGTSLEVNNTALQNDKDTSAPPSGMQICSATYAPASGDFNGSDSGKCLNGANGDAGSLCYDVTP